MTPRPVRQKLSLDAIVEAALEVLDDLGLQNLTTTNVAKRLGVSQPSMYNHVSSLDELRAAIAARGAADLSELVREAVMGRVRDDALVAMADAYRDYVRKYPDRYLLQLSAPRTPAHLEAMQRAAEAVRAVLRSYGLSEDDVQEAHTSFRAAVHGFVHLEARDALDPMSGSADAHFKFFVGLYAHGLRSIGALQR